MAERKFKDGDRVRLRSGGPVMTVEQFAEYTDGWKYECVWFEGGTKPMQGFYRETSLGDVPDDSAPASSAGPRRVSPWS
jgi:uncharacterized protein YodC (DUF2158 family)